MQYFSFISAVRIAGLDRCWYFERLRTIANWQFRSSPAREQVEVFTDCCRWFRVTLHFLRPGELFRNVFWDFFTTFRSGTSFRERIVFRWLKHGCPAYTYTFGVIPAHLVQPLCNCLRTVPWFLCLFFRKFWQTTIAAMPLISDQSSCFIISFLGRI